MPVITNDFYFADGADLLTASDGTKLAVNTGSYGVRIWSDIDTSPTAEDSDTPTTVFGSVTSGFQGIAAAIDSSDNIHVVAQTDTADTRDVAYCLATVSGGSWTFGTWELVANFTDGTPSEPFPCAIGLNSSDEPHVVYLDEITSKGATTTQVMHTLRTGGSWNTPDQVSARADKTDDYGKPYISVDSSGNLQTIYFSTAGATYPTDVITRTYTTSWQTEGVYTETTARPMGLVTQSGESIQYYHITSGGFGQVNDVTVISDMTSISINKTMSMTYVDSKFYLLYISDTVDVEYYYYDGSWNYGGTLIDTSSTDVYLEWSTFVQNWGSGTLSYMYRVAALNQLVYDELTLSQTPVPRHGFTMFQVPGIV